jgi:serine/threonine-protein kinase
VTEQPGSRRRFGLAWKIAATTTGLVAALLVAGLGAVWLVTQRLEGPEQDAALERSRDVAMEVLGERLRGLERIDALLANDPPFRAYIAEGDTPSVLDGLRERARLYGCDGFQVVLRDGRLLADSRMPGAAGDDLSEAPLIAPALEGERRSGIRRDGDRGLYLAAASPILQGGHDVLGAIVALKALDDPLALELRGVIGCDVLFVLAEGPVITGSSLQLPRAEAERVFGRSPLPARIPLSGRASAAARFDLPPMGGRPPGALVLVRAPGRELLAVRRIRTALLLAGLAALAVGVLTSVAMARRITKPLEDLVRATERVARGDYEFQPVARSSDEIGRLTESFRSMTSQLKDKDSMDRYLGAIVARATPAAAAAGGDTTATRAPEPRREPTPAPQPVPDLGDRFELLGTLGEGAFGTVWRARDRALGEIVALKLLRTETLARDPRAFERLKSEIRLARKITHRNVVRTFDLVELPGGFAIGMELVDGVPLSSLIGRARMPVGPSVWIASQICAGLDAAHGVGVVHRDLKPANVLVGTTGQVKIADFGIARAAADPAVGGRAGTPLYMAPEQIEGGDVDSRADLWGVAVILYEMLCGRTPFEAPTLDAVFEAASRKAPPSPRSFAPDLPSGLEAVLLRALEKNRERRYASATELATAIREGANPA